MILVLHLCICKKKQCILKIEKPSYYIYKVKYRAYKVCRRILSLFAVYKKKIIDASKQNDNI